MQKHESAESVRGNAAKKIAVVDENGKEYEATYLKRARGLVKHGRARFINENTICLACPPDNFKLTEDNSMTNIENVNVDLETGEVTEVPATEGKYTLEYFLEKIEKLSLEYSSEKTSEIVWHISNIKNESTPCGGSGEEIAKAAASAVREREETVRKMLDFYIRMVDELKPKVSTPTDDRKMFLDWVRDCTGAAEPGVEMPDYARLWNEMK